MRDSRISETFFRKHAGVEDKRHCLFGSNENEIRNQCNVELMLHLNCNSLNLLPVIRLMRCLPQIVIPLHVKPKFRGSLKRL
jgi:hypothetical protein